MGRRRAIGSRKSRIQGRVREVRSASPRLTFPRPMLSLERYTLPVIFDKRSARWRRRTGAYVSGTKIVPRHHAIALNIAINPISHLHPALSPRNPKMTGPRLGPRKGSAAKILIAKPLSRAEKQSAMTPPALARGEEPKAPAMNRRMIMLQI